MGDIYFLYAVLLLALNVRHTLGVFDATNNMTLSILHTDIGLSSARNMLEYLNSLCRFFMSGK
jgi:hypothetical protein